MQKQFLVIIFIALSSSLFTLCSAQVTIIQEFGNDGTEQPYGSLTLSVTGDTLFGMTSDGGTGTWGTIFSVKTDGTGYNTLYNFNGGTTDGGGPLGSLTFSVTKDTLFGLTSVGGTKGDGTIFSITTQGTNYTILYSFGTTGTVATDGKYPQGSLILSGGVLYGTTYEGGKKDFGTIFSYTLAGGVYAQVYTLVAANGEYPYGSLTLSGDILYGTTETVGTTDGNVFSYNLGTSTYKILYSFTGGTTDGANPYGGLTLSGGVLYGMTYNGGADGDGTIFSLTTAGTESVLYSFQGGTDGKNPYGSLTLQGGVLYGMTELGGTDGDGTIFSINPDGTGYTFLYNTAGGSGGNAIDPYGDITFSVTGDSLFGMARYGETGNDGVVFTVTTGGATLPIVLGAFSTQCDNGAALIQWTSESELNNNYFTIKKTADNIHFETVVGTVKGAGNSVFPINYSITDNSPLSGSSYYILYQTDFYGNATQLGVSGFNSCATTPVAPVCAYNTINYIEVQINAASDDNYTISLTNMLGQTLLNEIHPVALGENEIRLNNTLPAGVYILSVRNDKVNYTKEIAIGIR